MPIRAGLIIFFLSVGWVMPSLSYADNTAASELSTPLSKSSGKSSINLASIKPVVTENVKGEGVLRVNKSPVTSAVIIVLNKITTKSEKLIIPLKEAKITGKIAIGVERCIKEDNPYINPYRPDNLILIKIHDLTEFNKTKAEYVYHSHNKTNKPTKATITTENISKIEKDIAENNNLFHINNITPVFYSWVVTDNPSIANFEHPVYEVIPQGCLNN